MKMLNKDTDYAVRALIFLAQKKDFVSCKSIADKEKIPYRFLRRILGKLLRNSIIESKKGIKGGVKLLKNPKEINMMDLVELLQGDFKFSNCMFRKKICKNVRTCVLKKKLGRIEANIRKEFLKITIAGLLKTKK